MKQERSKTMNVAFIPVRGGSKSIPLKNLKYIGGKPLVYWTVKAAVECPKIDRVYVATDSPIIRTAVEEFRFAKVEVIDRSAESATDTASTEFAMLEFAEKYQFDTIALVQATSPLLTGEDLTGGLQLFEEPDTDSVLSVVPQKRFNWVTDADGFAAPLNYDFRHRPRRQEFAGYQTENGAFYITSRERLLKTKCRLSGRVRAYEMDETTFLEIDEPDDWLIVEQLMNRREERRRFSKLPQIKMLLTDSDGCLTDGGMYYTENGDEIKKFSTADGTGLRELREHGIITGIVTGENRELVRRRAGKLQMDELHMGIKDKLAVVREICARRGIDLSEVAYVGDDTNDMEVIKAVGFGCCVANGREEVKAVARYVTKTPGGSGAVREVTDLIIKAQREA